MAPPGDTKLLVKGLAAQARRPAKTAAAVKGLTIKSMRNSNLKLIHEITELLGLFKLTLLMNSINTEMLEI